MLCYRLDSTLHHKHIHTSYTPRPTHRYTHTHPHKTHTCLFLKAVQLVGCCIREMELLNGNIPVPIALVDFTHRAMAYTLKHFDLIVRDAPLINDTVAMLEGGGAGHDTPTHIHLHTHLHTRAYTHTPHIHTQIHTCTHRYTHIHTHIHTYICIRTYNICTYTPIQTSHIHTLLIDQNKGRSEGWRLGQRWGIVSGEEETCHSHMWCAVVFVIFIVSITPLFQFIFLRL